MAHGATHLHSLGPLATVEYRGAIDPGALQANDGEVKLVLASLDAPIVSAGVLSPFPTPSSNASIGANLSSGMHWNVQNNIWNTNFPQWYPFVPEDADSRFRFTMDVAVESRRS